MPTTTQTKAAPSKATPFSLPPDFLDGVPARALKLIGPEPDLQQRTEVLAKAFVRFETEKDRANKAINRAAELSKRIDACQDEADREKLQIERRDLTSELPHVPSDVMAAAKPFVKALQAWAHCATPQAKGIMLRLNPEILHLQKECEKTGRSIRFDQPPGKRAQGAKKKQIQDELEQLWSKLTPLQEQRKAARDVWSEIRGQLERRGFGEHGVDRWLQGVREGFVKRTMEPRGLTDVLRPRGF